MSDVPPPQLPDQPPPPPLNPPPGGYPPAPYGQPYGGLPEAQGATPAMVLGIIALVVTPASCCCGFIAVVPIAMGIVAVFMGVNARNRVNASQGTLGGGGKALAGIITGGIAAVLGLIFGVGYAILYGLGSSGVLNNLVNQLAATPTP
jgi:hypothetical protein